MNHDVEQNHVLLLQKLITQQFVASEEKHIELV